jgi:hypothetical protein
MALPSPGIDPIETASPSASPPRTASSSPNASFPNSTVVLDVGGDRQINSVLYVASVTQRTRSLGRAAARSRLAASSGLLAAGAVAGRPHLKRSLRPRRPHSLTRLHRPLTAVNDRHRLSTCANASERPSRREPRCTLDHHPRTSSAPPEIAQTHLDILRISDREMTPASVASTWLLRRCSTAPRSYVLACGCGRSTSTPPARRRTDAAKAPAEDSARAPPATRTTSRGHREMGRPVRSRTTTRPSYRSAPPRARRTPSFAAVPTVTERHPRRGRPCASSPTPSPKPPTCSASQAPAPTKPSTAVSSPPSPSVAASSSHAAPSSSSSAPSTNRCPSATLAADLMPFRDTPEGRGAEAGVVAPPVAPRGHLERRENGL